MNIRSKNVPFGMSLCWFSCLFFCFSLFLYPAEKVTSISTPVSLWRSSLYPTDWSLGYQVGGRSLHDFSYAGYAKGERSIPYRMRNIHDVTQPPYLADRTGVSDSTLAIQKAIDRVAEMGGGVVYLPSGTYKVAPLTSDCQWALKVKSSHIVIRGEGANKTFLFNNSSKMRDKKMIFFSPEAPPWWVWYGDDDNTSEIRWSLSGTESVIPIYEPQRFKVGDSVVVRRDFTEEFVDELTVNPAWGSAQKWTPASLNGINTALVFSRRVVAVNPIAKTITLDVPIRFPIDVADYGRVIKIGGEPIQEVGIEDLSIGMRQHPGDIHGVVDLGKTKFNASGTSAYDAHQSTAIFFQSVENGWIKNVFSYAPAGNSPVIHLLSNGIKLVRSRFVTVKNADLRFPQYQGEGGNGYLYSLYGQECLIRDSRAEGGRHNYDFGYTYSSGNVIYNSVSKKGLLPSDYHSYLSIANLIDGMYVDEDFLEATFRPYGGIPLHGETATRCVFWNTKGLRYAPLRSKIIVSHQWENGYVIGTSGPACAVESSDFVEGVGMGGQLQPQSLYLDQLSRRLGR